LDIGGADHWHNLFSKVVDMTTIKIKPFYLRKGKQEISHDAMVIWIIRKMRKLGQRLIFYDESPLVAGIQQPLTVMHFEERGAKNGKMSDVGEAASGHDRHS
jgi:hypothetical protein